MRIVYATPYYVPELKFGGPPRKIHSLAAGIAARGHSINVLTFASNGRRSIESRSVDNVSVQDLRWIGRKLKQVPLDRGTIRNAIGAADLVHAFGIYNLLSPMSARCARVAGIPFILEPLGMYPPRAGNQLGKRAYNRILTKSMVRHASAVIGASEAEAAELAEIADPEKIVYRRNGIDIESFEQLPNGDHLKKIWQISPGEQVILYIGRISPIKNLEQLILAFAEAKLPGARLVLVGPLTEPAYEKQLRQLIVSRQLNDRVTFAGPLYEGDRSAALEIADLFVLPSVNESFGNAAGEAVAANVPVLLTDTCGIASLIHERAGYAVPLGVAKIADGMRRMLNPGFRDQMTARRDEVKRELSWDEPIEQTIALYERIVAESRKSKVESRKA